MKASTERAEARQQEVRPAFAWEERGSSDEHPAHNKSQQTAALPSQHQYRDWSWSWCSCWRWADFVCFLMWQEDEDEDSEEARRKLIARDEYRDMHKRGSGNRKNRS